MNECAICGAAEPGISVTRPLVPSMQNLVHRTPEAARASAHGRFSLATCRSCAFSWNAAFDPSKLAYGSGYDNAVPSAVMDRHYADVATMLGRRHGLEHGYVVDVGCGNGGFLETLCDIWPGCRGLGLDPALPRDEVLAGGRLRLIKGVFSPDQLEDRPSLFVSRHVLEHMPDPVTFVRELRAALGDRTGVPLFVEVPDLEWILEEQAFWDFCHEHCNYFTDESLATVLGSAGFASTSSGTVFGRQYRWMEGESAAPTMKTAGTAPTLVARLQDYAAGEERRVQTIRERLRALHDAGRVIAVWGMATKGIMFSLMVDPDSTLIDYAVDVNVNKQGGYVPISGRRIEAPAALRAAAQPVVVVVMNPNYLGEIAGTCRDLGVRCAFLDAAGVELVAA